MKTTKMIYLSIGFVAGIVYLVACGGSKNVQEAISESINEAVKAAAIAYDNAASKLTATNVQSAIDELASNQAQPILRDNLIGGWSGKKYSGSIPSDVALTLNNDGTCSGTTECQVGATWELFENIILIKLSGAMSQYSALQIIKLDSSNLIFLGSGGYLQIHSKI